MDWPFKIVRKLTILPCNHDEDFDKRWTYVWGIPGMSLFWWLFKIEWVKFTYIGIPIGLFFSIFFFVLLKDWDIEKSK